MRGRHCLLAVALSATVSIGYAQTGYFRQPSLHGDALAFTSEGDLWLASTQGGSARRLTTHPGEETRAKLSPDGRWIAFSAGYEGPTEVYVMPTAGGSPTRLTFENGRALALGWTAEGEVLYSTPGSKTWSMTVAAVDPATRATRLLPLADANDAVVDANGRWMYFIRFGLSLTNDNARGYRGGAMAQLWRFALDDSAAEAQRIGPTAANLRQPMTWNDRLVVIADIDGIDNLWLLGTDGSAPQALTRHRDYAVRNASIDGNRIAYQHGADIRLLDLTDRTDRRVDIALPSDFGQQRERWIDDPLRYLETTAFSPKGDRVALTARGRVALAGVSKLRRVEVGAPDGVRSRSAVLSHDGASVFVIADADDAEEIWRYPADGGSSGERLTHDGDVRRWHLYPSPDGRHLAHDDKRGRLWLLDLADGRNRLIDDGGADGNEQYADVAWSADGKHLAFVRATGITGRSRIGLHTLHDSQTRWLTSDKYESGSPAFSPDGHWLWFLSQREFRLANGSPWGDRNTGPYFDKRTKIYALALQPDQRFPFQPDDELSDDEATKENKKDEDPAKKGQAADDLPALVTDGLTERLYEVPLAAGNYDRLRATGDRLYFLDGNGSSAALKYAAFDRARAETTTVLDNVAEYGLSADGKKIYLRQPGSGDTDFGSIYIADTATKLPDDRGRVAVSLDDWRLRIDPATEWQQLFADAWRMHRDYFYDDALRGVDWLAVRKRYAPLLSRVGDRHELDDLLGQMIGELGALHSQIVPGDTRSADDVAVPAFLGGRFDRVDDGWRVAHIHRTEPELPSTRGPLQAPGVDIAVGDVIVAINGRSTASVRDLSDLLRDQAGKQVLIEVKRGGAAPQQQIVVPVDAQRESQLRYGDWVMASRDRVETTGQGRIGYLHLYAMGANDIAGFVREFYAQIDRPALIIDVRRNRGGNIDSWIIEKLLRRAWAFWQRPKGLPYTNMQQTFRGHLAVLIDGLTYSDGETFAAGIQRLKLAPLIGTRTAGAGVWLSDGNRLADRGRARVAEYPQYGLDGEWLVEGVGVSPDIVVDNLPHASFEGSDAQLDAAIGWLERKLHSEPMPPLQRRAIPPLPSLTPDTSVPE